MTKHPIGTRSLSWIAHAAALLLLANAVASAVGALSTVSVINRLDAVRVGFSESSALAEPLERRPWVVELNRSAVDRGDQFRIGPELMSPLRRCRLDDLRRAKGAGTSLAWWGCKQENVLRVTAAATILAAVAFQRVTIDGGARSVS